MKLTPRVGVIDGGLHHEAAFKDFKDFAGADLQRIRAGQLSRTCLRKYDVVIVPFHTDDFVLRTSSGKLISFVNNGGVLVLLGPTSNWMPFCNWKRPGPELIGNVVMNPKSQDACRLFENIDPAAIKFHPPDLPPVHGSLSESSERTVLASVNGRCVMFVQRKEEAGTLLYTTLDPDHHVDPMMSIGEPERLQRVEKTARTLLENILRWAKAEAEKKSRWQRRKNRVIGSLQSTGIMVGLFALFLLPFAMLASKYLTPAQVVCSAVVSGLGSVTSVWQAYIVFKAGRESRVG